MKNIVDKLKYLALVVPVYAANDDVIKFKPGNDTWLSLENLTIPGIISGAISLIMLVVALVFFFMLIWGGLRWVTSQGEEKAVASARAQITNALIGLAIVFAAWAIMKLIEIVFGVSILDGITIPKFTQ